LGILQHMLEVVSAKKWDAKAQPRVEEMVEMREALKAGWRVVKLAASKAGWWGKTKVAERVGQKVETQAVETVDEKAVSSVEMMDAT